MNKFWILFKKEIKELLTLKMILPLIVMTFLFAFIGQLLTGQQEKIQAPANIGVLNQDSNSLTDELLKFIEQNNFILNKYENLSKEEAINISRESGDLAFINISNNFTQNLHNLKSPELEVYSFIKGFSFISTFETSKIDALKLNINEYLSNREISERLPEINPVLLKNPTVLKDFVVLNDKMAQIGFQSVVGFVQSQTTFVPIILFFIIVIASQMVATTIASEKENKSFEILLSSPLNRKTIVLAKILASGLVALLFAGFYMIGFSFYMSGFNLGSVQQSAEIQNALLELGVIISPLGYVLIGLSLFLSILSALVVAIILGTMAEDVKGVQAVTTPLMILVLLPYFVTLFLDINSISVILKYLIYAIPFSYPFFAMQKVVLGDYLFVIYGLIYQLIFFAVFVVLASKIFTSDLVLTWKLSFKRKSDVIN